MKHILVFLLAVVAYSNAMAQGKSPDYYRNNPVWIQMMDEEHVKYAEAVKAFNLFWENREKPTEENEMFSASEQEKEQKDFVTRKKAHKEADAVKYAFEFKKFMRWQVKVQSYLNVDGTVMNADERIVAWKKQLDNRK
jgi:hypothetical protein